MALLPAKPPVDDLLRAWLTAGPHIWKYMREPERHRSRTPLHAPVAENVSNASQLIQLPETDGGSLEIGGHDAGVDAEEHEVAALALDEHILHGFARGSDFNVRVPLVLACILALHRHVHV